MAFDLIEASKPYLSEVLASRIGADWAAVLPLSVLVTRDEDHHDPAPESIVCEVPNNRGGKRQIVVGVFHSREGTIADLADRVAQLRADR